MLLNSFLLSLNTIVSIFVMMAVGYGAKRLLRLDKGNIQRFNALVFHTLLPIMLFNNIYKSNIRGGVSFHCLGLALGVLAVLFLLTWALVTRVEPDNRQRGVMIQASFRSNFLLLGMPLIQELCPGADLATVSVMLAIVVPCFNALAVFTLETFRHSQVNVRQVLLGIAKNPLIIASALGIAANLSGLPLPDCFASPISQMGASASPVALLLLGAQFEFRDVRQYRRNLAICTVLRLIVFPGAALPLAALTGLRGPEFAVLISMFATPTAVASFSMASQMGGNPELAASAVTTTTLLSAGTMFLWIFLFKSLGMF
ncbi:MAG: AEC family transporter [Oscillospiraceae bacterium]|nr:AEC family transporter [Oscillospiraceae bacterium]